MDCGYFRPDAQIYEWVAAEATQIRVAVTFDDIAYAELGTTMGKVNSAFPVDASEYDKPNVGKYVFGGPAASNKEEEGEK